MEDVLGQSTQGGFRPSTGRRAMTGLTISRMAPISRIALVIAGLTGSTVLATPAMAQDKADAQAPATAPSTVSDRDIVVTGFRSSLTAALQEKRASAAAIDAIKAEDVGKFPDSNLAESMQRVPGIALARGDGGEGKNIAVRGLGAAFTRVRLNGMEGTAQTGSSDIYGAGNTGRSFDFNVFPTEIFSELAVRKTPSADVEEGSLGATVDLKARIRSTSTRASSPPSRPRACGTR
jgi:outer membrane receptor for ferrienterochelin and colicin